MGALADLYKRQNNVTDKYFPEYMSVRPYGKTSAETQQEMAMPDMGAAKERSLNSLGALLPLLGLGLGMAHNNDDIDTGRIMRGASQSFNRNLDRQTALEVWKAEQINRRKQAQVEAAKEQLKAGRERIEQVFNLDPSLWADQKAMAYYQLGDYMGLSEYLASKGWKPKRQTNLTIKEINGRTYGIDPRSGDIVKDYGPSRTGGGDSLTFSQQMKVRQNKVAEKYYKLYQQAISGGLSEAGAHDFARRNLDPAEMALLDNTPSAPSDPFGINAQQARKESDQFMSGNMQGQPNTETQSQGGVLDSLKGFGKNIWSQITGNSGNKEPITQKQYQELLKRGFTEEEINSEYEVR
jgi:SOS response regulatory protein OraA/RecX